MANLKTRLKENWRKNKVSWILFIACIVVIISGSFFTYTFGQERGMMFSLLLFFLYGICSGIYMTYYSLRYKKAMSMIRDSVSKKDNPAYYYFATLVFIGMLIFFSWALIMLIIYKF